MKMLAVLIVVVGLLVMSGGVFAEGLMAGDANGDGSVDAGDITKVMRIYFELDEPCLCADANQDGHIDVGDMLKIRRIYFGLDEGFPCRQLAGDVDGNGIIDWNDIEVVRDLYFEGGYESCADANQDGIIDAGDVVKIKNILYKWDQPLFCE